MQNCRWGGKVGEVKGELLISYVFFWSYNEYYLAGQFVTLLRGKLACYQVWKKQQPYSCPRDWRFGSQLRAPLEPLSHHSTIVLRTLRGALINWASIMPRDASLSDSQCDIFSSLACSCIYIEKTWEVFGYEFIYIYMLWLIFLWILFLWINKFSKILS